MKSRPNDSGIVLLMFNMGDTDKLGLEAPTIMVQIFVAMFGIISA